MSPTKYIEIIHIFHISIYLAVLREAKGEQDLAAKTDPTGLSTGQIASWFGTFVLILEILTSL
jgi:hypothetical protein